MGCIKNVHRFGMMRAFLFITGVVPWFLGAVLVTAASAAGKVPVFVSIVPQKYFVEKIGGERVDIAVMVEPGASPHHYEPKPRQMAALAKTKIYYAIGIEFERVWLEKIAAINRNMRIVHTERGIEKIPMKAHHHHEEGEYDHGAVEHHHGEGGAKHVAESHDRRIKDPHIWLAPPLVMVQARNILQGLLATDPAHRSTYEANYKKFIVELINLDAELREIFAEKGECIEFMVFHPAWGYFAQAYGLEQVPVEIEGKEPKPTELRNLIEHARERGIKVIFVTPQFSTKSAETVASAIGGQIAFVDPLAKDWVKNLREVAEKFKTALR